MVNDSTLLNEVTQGVILVENSPLFITDTRFFPYSALKVKMFPPSNIQGMAFPDKVDIDTMGMLDQYGTIALSGDALTSLGEDTLPGKICRTKHISIIDLQSTRNCMT